MSLTSALKDSGCRLAWLVHFDFGGISRRYAECTEVVGGVKFKGAARFRSSPGVSLDPFSGGST